MKIIQKYHVRRSEEEVEDFEVELELLDDNFSKFFILDEIEIVVGNRLFETAVSKGLRKDPVRIPGEEA